MGLMGITIIKTNKKNNVYAMRVPPKKERTEQRAYLKK